MNSLKAGFARVQITPPLGTSVEGYLIKRKAERVLDDLYANTLALSAGGSIALIVSVDLISMSTDVANSIREYIKERTGVPIEAISLCCTHSHTATRLSMLSTEENAVNYRHSTKLKIADSCIMAIEDLKDAKMGVAKSYAPRISFGRRYRMKDGSVRTNPGVNNPDILEPIGEIDESVNVIRFNRADDDIVLVNFATHPDTIGGNVISADWPGFVRTTLERALDNTKCIFVNGAEGDVNHVNVMPLSGEENGLHKDFDDVDRGYDHAKHMGQAVAGAALLVYEKVKYVDVEKIGYAVKSVSVPANLPDPSEIPLAIKYHELHKAGRDDEIPFTGMALTSAITNANRIVRLKNGPESFQIPVSALLVGNVGFVGIAGEPFSGIGLGIKENLRDKCDMVSVFCLTNGSVGYFPMMDSYVEGGYEAGCSSFKAGVAEILIDEATKLLKSLI